jgi:hypothetical protein
MPIQQGKTVDSLARDHAFFANPQVCIDDVMNIIQSSHTHDSIALDQGLFPFGRMIQSDGLYSIAYQKCCALLLIFPIRPIGIVPAIRQNLVCYPSRRTCGNTLLKGLMTLVLCAKSIVNYSQPIALHSHC